MLLSLAGNRGRVEHWEACGRAFLLPFIDLQQHNALLVSACDRAGSNDGSVQCGLLAGLIGASFAGLQVWWIGSTLSRNRQRDLARPMSGREFKRSLEGF